MSVGTSSAPGAQDAGSPPAASRPPGDLADLGIDPDMLPDGLVVAGVLALLEVLLELQLLGAELALVLGAKAALLRPHQPARGSSRCTNPASTRSTGSAWGATRQIASASNSPASRSIT